MPCWAFQVKARRTTKLGQWAAGTLGLTGAEVDAYIRDVRTAGLSEKGDAEVFGKIAADFKAKAINVGDLEIRAAMNRYLSEAIPLATITAGRVTNLYDLMDSAYDAPGIRVRLAWVAGASSQNGDPFWRPGHDVVIVAGECRRACASSDGPG